MVCFSIFTSYSLPFAMMYRGFYISTLVCFKIKTTMIKFFFFDKSNGYLFARVKHLNENAKIRQSITITKLILLSKWRQTTQVNRMSDNIGGFFFYGNALLFFCCCCFFVFYNVKVTFTVYEKLGYRCLNKMHVLCYHRIKKPHQYTYT